MRSKKETEVRKLVVGMYSAFPRSQMIGEAALDIWVYALKDYPVKDIRQAVSKWINSKDWPPDNLNKFIGAISKFKFSKQSEPELPGYREWLKEYRADGLARESTGDVPDNSNEPPTPRWKASLHWKLVYDIADGKVRCPRSIAKHDVFAIDDDEERWYWAEFNKRVRRARR